MKVIIFIIIEFYLKLVFKCMVMNGLLGVNEVLFFNTTEELILNIKNVLENEELSERLSKNARLYFEKHVDPVQNVKRILELMIAKSKN